MEEFESAISDAPRRAVSGTMADPPTPWSAPDPPAPTARDDAPATAPSGSVGRSSARDGWVNQAETYLTTHGEPVWRLIQRATPVRDVLNRALVHRAIMRVPTRPNPLSTMAAYTSWPSLTDRTFDGRHLPPAADPGDLPDVEVLAEEFRRREFKPCPKSTVLFAHFAQWFTDGFLRSDRSQPPDPRKNTSNHEIDLCQVYGLTEAVTRQLRTGAAGQLKSQQLNGEEFPPHLCQDGVPKGEFDRLSVVAFDRLSPAQRGRLFALGGDRANAELGYTAISVLFLREHNRIARLLATGYPRWDDERLFQTARNVLTVALLKIVIGDYINHITPYHFRFSLDPRGARGPWHRQNWMSVEFSLLYRWHSLVPSTLFVGERALPIRETLFATDLLVEHGVARILGDASTQPAGRVGLRNTDEALLDIERASVRQARSTQVASYNDYREHCGFPRVTAFDQITGDAGVQRRLRELYRTVDRIEYYVGLFAEDARPDSVLPSLMGRLVGADAFSQALSNPLLAPRVFNERTFTRLGMAIIRQTNTLSDVVRRNQPADRPTPRITMTRPDWRRGRGTE